MNVLITGASRGIGLEFVKQYLKDAEVTVFAAVRNPSNAPQLQELVSQHESRVNVLTVDVSNEEQIKVAAKQLEEAGTHLDVLVNNAASTVPADHEFCGLGQQDLLDVLNVNTVGPYLMIKHFLPLLHKGSKKLIVNIGSRVGSVTAMLEPTPPGGAAMERAAMAYRVSKCALNYETAFFAKNLGPEGFTVVCLHPGWVDTDLGAAAGRKPPTSAEESVVKMLGVLNSTETAELNGKFLSFKGEELPW